MKKRLTKNELRDLRIHNSYDIAKFSEQKIFVAYTSADYGRLSQNANWQVVKIGFKTDPNGAWYNHGHKTFHVYSRDEKKPQLAEALKWVSETYGINDWEKDPFGNYQVVGTVEIAIKKHMEALNETAN